MVLISYNYTSYSEILSKNKLETLFTHLRKCGYVHIVSASFQFPHGPCFQSGPHIKSSDNVREATPHRTHSHCGQSAGTLPGKLSKFFGKLCSLTWRLWPFVQDTKRVDNELTGTITTRKRRLNQLRRHCWVTSTPHTKLPQASAIVPDLPNKSTQLKLRHNVTTSTSTSTNKHTRRMTMMTTLIM